MDTGIMKLVVPIIAHSLYNARPRGVQRVYFFTHNLFLPALKVQIRMTEKPKLHTLITIVVSRNEQEELSL